VKAAPVGKALRTAGHTEVLVHTGQHYDLTCPSRPWEASCWQL